MKTDISEVKLNTGLNEIKVICNPTPSYISYVTPCLFWGKIRQRLSLLALFLQPVTRREFRTEQTRFWIRIELEKKHGTCCEVRVAFLMLISYHKYHLQFALLLTSPGKMWPPSFSLHWHLAHASTFNSYNFFQIVLTLKSKSLQNDPRLNPGPTWSFFILIRIRNVAWNPSSEKYGIL